MKGTASWSIMRQAEATGSTCTSTTSPCRPRRPTRRRNDISGGKNVIDLSGFGNSILSLKLDEADLRARIIVDLLQ